MRTSDVGTSKKILIVAAEASSSLYAQRLLEHWKSNKIAVEAFGIGNREMEKLGFNCLGYAEELAVVGLQEVLSNFKLIYKVFHQLIEAAEKRRPDLVSLMDYPDFNFRLAKALHKRGFKIVYYISPQIWAWRQNRVHFIKKYFDKMLVLFPFEVDFYRKFQVEAQFVGHPLLDEIKPELLDGSLAQDLRGRYGIANSDFVLGLMPGSRKSELKHHLLVQMETARILLKNNSKLRVLLLVAPTLDVEFVKSQLPENLDIKVTLVKRDPFEMTSMCDFVLCASGTATLTVALMEKPMAIMYKMNALTIALAKFIMPRPKFFGMANLILDEMVAKEFLQSEANPMDLAHYIEPFLQNATLCEQQTRKFKQLKALLGSSGVTQRVSQILVGS